MHATLVFLGSTDPRDVVAIVTALRAVAGRHAPIHVSTAQAGGRLDDRRAGVAWLSISAGRHDLAHLSRDLDTAIGSEVYASMAPRPHLTVVRRVDQALLDDLRRAADGGARAEWRVDEVVLFRSHTGPQGSLYEPLATFGLLTRTEATS
jgi:2'-5' RNA ligase